MSEQATRIAQTFVFVAEVRDAVGELGNRQAIAWRGLDRRLEEQKSLLVHLQRQERAEHHRRPVRPGQQVVLLAAARLARLTGNESAADRFEERAAVAPAMSGTATWASELTAAGLPGFVLSLERRSALAAILGRSPQVSLLKTGTQRVPVAGAAPPAVIVAEGSAIPVQRGNFTPLTLTPFKLASILHYTDELQNASNIEAITRVLLEQSVAAGMDAVAFSTGALGGLLLGVVPIAASTATPLSEAMRQDLQNLVAALDTPSADVVFVMSPSRAVFATSVLPSSFAYSIATSAALPAATVVAVDAQGIAAALANDPRIVASISAAAHEDTAATALAGVGATVISSPTCSAFQTNTIFVRIVADVAWAARVGAVSSITAGW